jgi:hypothetical protein
MRINLLEEETFSETCWACVIIVAYENTRKWLIHDVYHVKKWNSINIEQIIKKLYRCNRNILPDMPFVAITSPAFHALGNLNRKQK